MGLGEWKAVVCACDRGENVRRERWEAGMVGLPPGRASDVTIMHGIETVGTFTARGPLRHCIHSRFGTGKEGGTSLSATLTCGCGDGFEGELDNLMSELRSINSY